MAEPAPHAEEVADLVDALAPLLVRRFREEVYAALQPHCPIPLRDGTYPLLVALAAGPGDAAQVSAAVGVDRTVVVKQAAVLEEAGLLERAPHPTRARVVALRLTPTGQHVAADLQSALVRLVESLASGVASADLRATVRVLQALTDGVRRGPA